MAKLDTKKVFWFSVIAGLGFILVFAFVYPFVTTVGVPWWNQILGIEEAKEGEKPPGFMYSGLLNLNLPMYDVYDDSTITPTDIVCKLWHADETTLVGSKTTPDGSDDITGEVFASDQGILYLSVDHNGTTIYYTLDQESEDAGTYLTALTPKDVDDDGILDHYFKVDITNLSPLAAGETQKEITINLYTLDADVTDLAATSQLNGTSADLSDTSYLDLYATGYLSGISEGDGFKFVRVELTMPDSGNETYVNDGMVKNVWVSLGYGKDKTYKWDSMLWQPGQDRFLAWEATDIAEEVYARSIIYERGAGDTFASYQVHIQGANFDAGAVWKPTVKITYISPAGVLGTISRIIEFRDTA